ncbi:MAG: hypothetical protein J07HX5_00435 [halophilic archaeon J07HX5]|nr:MAG: hypothetical protein J07HX5_00435 [halophilic archaeon J07HX5]
MLPGERDELVVLLPVVNVGSGVVERGCHLGPPRHSVRAGGLLAYLLPLVKSLEPVVDSLLADVGGRRLGDGLMKLCGRENGRVSTVKRQQDILISDLLAERPPSPRGWLLIAARAYRCQPKPFIS